VRVVEDVMKPINHLAFVFLFMLFILVGGCGETRWTENYYYYPDWTPDGEIICMKEVADYRKSLSMPFPGIVSTDRISTKYYITTMSEEGTNEVAVKEVDSIGKVCASPLGNYIAYTDGQYIKIITTSGQAVNSIDCTTSDFGFDWGNDESKIIYCNGSTGKVFLINRDGSSEQEIADNGWSVAWRYSDKIVMNKPLGNETYRIVAVNSGTLSEEAVYTKVNGGCFNISMINTNEVIFGSDYGIKKFYLNSPEADPVLLNSVTNVLGIRLSLDGERIIGTGNGSGDDLGKEIWIINIDGTGLEQLR